MKRPNVILAIAGLVAFAGLALAVQQRLTASIDLAFTPLIQRLSSPALDAVSSVLSIAFSAELSILMGLCAALWLWRRSGGVWSVAPLAFVILDLVELLLKLVIPQPAVPPEFSRHVYYPLLSVVLAGSFPSGHAIRIAFFATFVAVWLKSSSRTSKKLAAPIVFTVGVLMVFTRVYLGQHWLSDVVGGLILGACTAQLVATEVNAKVFSSRQPG